MSSSHTVPITMCDYVPLLRRLIFAVALKVHTRPRHTQFQSPLHHSTDVLIQCSIHSPPARIKGAPCTWLIDCVQGAKTLHVWVYIWNLRHTYVGWHRMSMNEYISRVCTLNKPDMISLLLLWLARDSENKVNTRGGVWLCTLTT